uniref:14_3_3 domain-containing protein n=1 Tax=Macrostomum lignano TaxID=282301 RepID=A0A1I8HGF6_9PLAT
MLSTNESMVIDWFANSSPAPREELVHLARLAEQAERYEDMASAMKSVAEKGRELGVEERNLLSVAYKNFISPRRISWRLIAGIEVKMNDTNDRKRANIKEFRQQIESELQKICTEVQNLLDDHLLKNARSDESIIFYYKMKGDYYRYLAETSIGNDRGVIIENADRTYSFASKSAEEKLACTHPIRLGLALNYSVFLQEIKNESSAAISLAKAVSSTAVHVQSTQ